MVVTPGLKDRRQVSTTEHLKRNVFERVVDEVVVLRRAQREPGISARIISRVVNRFRVDLRTLAEFPVAESVPFLTLLLDEIIQPKLFHFLGWQSGMLDKLPPSLLGIVPLAE